jgi:hypothetical protein
MVLVCACGQQHASRTATQYAPPRQEPTRHGGPQSCPVNLNANICRQCPSGKYDPDRDACLEVIQIGKNKGYRRAGKINWLHYHLNASCPLGFF